MHTLSGLMRGGKSGPAVVPGKLEESELYQRITLDPSHEKFMPADGKPPLTKGETTILTWWIENGLAAEGKKISELKDVEKIKPELALFLGLSSSQGDNERIIESSNKVNPEIPNDFNIALLDSLRNKGVYVRIMNHNPVMLDVTLPSDPEIKIEQVKPNLLAVAKNVVWLNLSDNGLLTSDLDFLPAMINLEKLRLEKNPLTDAIANHLISLHHLEAVNLNETRITQKCLEQLRGMKNLKRIYGWNTLAE